MKKTAPSATASGSAASAPRGKFQPAAFTSFAKRSSSSRTTKPSPKSPASPSAPASTTAISPTLTDDPCPRCLPMAQAGDLRMEMVQRLPEGARAPRSVPHNDGDYRGPCCFDCGAADTLVKLDHVFDFEQARIAAGNDRQEQYPMPR